MLMSYVGSLKTQIYGPILRNLGVNLWTLRVPMLLAATVSIWLFFLLLRRLAGDRAALIGCALLACDSLFLLTAAFDWGPVALQHLLLIGGALALVRFFQARGSGALAGAAFLFGLAMWDKALAVWSLSGLAIAGILTFPRQIFDALTARRLLIAVLAFCLGALPLLVYNADNQWGTFTGNFQRNTGDIPRKALILFRTFSGSGLFGWMTGDDRATPQPHAPVGALEKASAAISSAAGHPHESLLFYGFLLALLLAPLAGPTGLRMILLALIAIAVAWVQMAINQNTGGSIHHTILLWPLPHFIMAISFSAASYRLGRAGIPAAAAITAVLAISGALVINEYIAQAVRNGGTPSWTEAIFPLSADLKTRPSNWVFALDWGITDPLRLLQRGRLRVTVGTDQLSKPELSAQDRAQLQQMISTPGNLFIDHTPDFAFQPSITGKLTEFAAQAGYRRELLTEIPDSHGRAVYEVYRFVSNP